METLSGSEMVIRALQAEGVEVVVGLPGGTVIPLYDAIHDTKKPFHVLVRHEQAAAHAARPALRRRGVAKSPRVAARHSHSSGP